MAAPFTITSVSNYNSNPPSDDGSQTASNRVQWSTQKTKLADPVYNAFNSSETETSDAFGKVVGGAGIITTAVDYTVTSSDQSKLVKATASGITITTPDATVVGTPFVFGLLNGSSGDITFAGNGTQTIDGSDSFTIPFGCGVMVNTDGSNWFTWGQNFNNVLQPPQGYLTLTSGTPIITGDVTAATVVYYTPFKGDRVPISTDGSTFKMRQFSELTLTLSTNHVASGIYDVFLFDNSGVTTIGTGPVWNTVTAGSCDRGTGAATSELTRLHGFHVNANSMTARNGSTTYTVAANEGLFVGSIYIDSTAGEVTCHRTYGQSRKWGISNAYNRVTIRLKAGDSTTSWNYTTATIRQSNGSTGNTLVVFDCLGEEEIKSTFKQKLSYVNVSNTANQGGGSFIGIGWNSTTAFSGTQGMAELASFSIAGPINYSINFLATATGEYVAPPALGINSVNALEQTTGNSGQSFYGTEADMLLTAEWAA